MKNSTNIQKKSSKKSKCGVETTFFFLSGREIRKRAAQGYAEFLEVPAWGWQEYVTLTFKEEIHPEQADKYFKRWIRQINEINFGTHYRKHGYGITWARGLEFQRRGVIHFHALLSGLSKDFSRFLAMYLWEKTGDNCGIARIYPYVQGACPYLAKYVGKGGEIDIFISKDRDKLDLFREALFT